MGFHAATALSYAGPRSVRFSTSNESWKCRPTMEMRQSYCATAGPLIAWRTGRDLTISGRQLATIEEQLKRYDAVIHLRTPQADEGYNHENPLRTESAAAAAEIDARLLRAWERHPRRFIIDPSKNFLEKAARALEVLRAEMPECCRQHVVPGLEKARQGRPTVG